VNSFGGLKKWKPLAPFEVQRWCRWTPAPRMRLQQPMLAIMRPCDAKPG
jgi:hypothetical protein